ncbi:MAG TPA: hypothetical protein VN612_16735 [Acidobacteriaceae bacterium]|nr:hypothetical protein [Acidobacteriaceae bacterium]
MKAINEQQLRNAIERAGLPFGTFDRIHAELAAEPETSARFEAAHVAYYLGALLIIGAMGWFITNAWDSLPGVALSATAIAYGAIFGRVGYWLSQKPATKVPGGVLAAVAVCMTPLAVYGIERQIGWWPSTDPGGYSRFHPYIDASWVLMELGTVFVAGLMLRLVRFPFITAPAAYALWYLSMDATAFLFGKTWTFRQECYISIAFGVAMMLTAFLADRRFVLDYSFWFYLFGLLTFTGGLSSLGDGNQLGKAVYCLLHLGLMVLAIILQRRAFLIFGGLGVFLYLMDEAQGYFRNSFGFTFALTIIGMLFIFAGIAFKRNEQQLTQAFAPWIPERLRQRPA